MGGGISGFYEGTVGANPSYYRPPFSEIASSLSNKKPIEYYATEVAKGVSSAASSKKKKVKSCVKSEDVLIMIENYYANTVNNTNFVNWLELICTDPVYVMDFDLRALLLEILGAIKKADTHELFLQTLSSLEEQIRLL